MSWADSFVVIDTETTGFRKTDRVIELGAVTFEDGKVAREWSTLLRVDDIDWKEPSVAEALNINRIDPRELADAPTFQEVLADILLEIDLPVWVGHNVAFDIRMIKQEMERLQRTLVVPPLQVCTKILSQRLQRGGGNRLEDVCCRYGVIPHLAHRASADAAACGQVLVRMLEQNHVPRDNLAMARFCGSITEQYKR